MTTAYIYNLTGKPISITAGGKTKSYTYASTGSILSETSESGTITYTYDDTGRVASETSDGKTTAYTYDRAGNVLTITVNGSTTGYTYDVLNRLVSVVNGSTRANYTYDTAGHRIGTQVVRTNGTTNSTISRTTYAYNYAGAITSQINYDSRNYILSQFTYTYDVQGNILTAYDSTTGKTANYAYDALGRLLYESKGGTTRVYQYDEAGNRIKAIVDTDNTIYYTYDSDGRLIRETQSNGQTGTVIDYTYDNNGNLTSKTEGIKTTTYTFDVWGNMVSAAGADYTYNVQGLRTSKTVGNKTTNFTVVNGKIFSDGTRNYVWGLELITSSNSWDVYYLYNAHGDVVQLVFPNIGVVRTYDYDAYGNELARDLSDPNPFRYCGEYYDTETGFIYLRARYYDPSNGRFISADPAKDGLNWYAYCNNNPVALVDRNGLWVETAWDLISLGMSIYDVCQNPHDPWAWFGLAGDAADVLIPFFGGIGEAIKGSRAIGIVATKVDDVADAATDAVRAINKIDDVADAATDAAKAINKIDDVADAAKTTEKLNEVRNAANKAADNNKDFFKWLSKGDKNYKVYYGIADGKEVYVGITKQDLPKRLYQHNYNGKDFKELEDIYKNVTSVGGLTRNEARALEQYFIELNKYPKNLINSISKNNKYYSEASKWAKNFTSVFK